MQDRNERIFRLLAIVTRFKWFFLCAGLVLIGVGLTLVYVPSPHTQSLSQPSQNPLFIDMIGVAAIACLCVGLTEDYYRCVYKDKPTLLFASKEDYNKRKGQDIHNYPFMRYVYQIIHKKE